MRKIAELKTVGDSKYRPAGIGIFNRGVCIITA
jgi:hypothetical protein